MPLKFATFGAIIGSTLMALSLGGSHRNPANTPDTTDQASLIVSKRLYTQGAAALSAGRYQDAREAFHAAATTAQAAGFVRKAAMDWGDAGYASLLAMQYRPALEDLTRAKQIAQASHELVPLIYTLNNLTSLYLQMGAPQAALRIAEDALAGPAGHAHAGMRAELLYHKALALAKLDRFTDAEPVFRQALPQLVLAGDFETAARGWTGFGAYYREARRYREAETAFNESLRLVKRYNLRAAANALTNLAILRGKQGDLTAAEALFQAALDTHESVTPLWMIHYDRGTFRLEHDNLSAALDDFRRSQELANQMRADIVPADQDRVAIENRVSKISEGLVDAGNRLALATDNQAVLAETFDAAEKNRLWSLRSLVPDANDWRSRLPARYWDLLLRFQSAQRTLLAQAQTGGDAQLNPVRKQVEDLDLQLQQAEAAAGGGGSAHEGEPSRHVRALMDRDTVLFSFSLTNTSAWLWAVDGEHIAVYSLPPADRIKREVEEFTGAIRSGGDAAAPGEQLFNTLFGAVPDRTLAHRKWLLEPDGPLYELPFAALPFRIPGATKRPGDSESRSGGYLIEHAALQSIPGALLLENGHIEPNGSFIGIGDPIFNAADSRYRRNPGLAAGRVQNLVLPRLPNTAAELNACLKAWYSGSPASSALLTGEAASVNRVESALSASLAVVHFATHVVTAPGDYGSGLIALTLDTSGAIGLLGPKDIAAHRVSGALVVMNGCHSSQGQALAGSGLMGLTRAWIGAGARAVVSTGWDVPDDSTQSLMVTFYRALRQSSGGNPAMALREAQLAAIHSNGPAGQPSRWAGYLLLSRI